ncbi:unnamed protein product [Aphanomyces euteiches]|uniref:MIF4G domain-containing protein n=1 Tax=Aphanomyces euteiches TaxID=100861 RepID=A0A6G0WVR6_9STRA|nr:hypothetical protein Ae201684_011249 [Aphanomyces euteiches]KAH9058575.1 hypothetical protein Ae201684P_005918 [Aphanomyces euteiches]KAH9136747.1 hypothetical protein AeRB84_018262 [Aphanomyces euteiches]
MADYNRDGGRGYNDNGGYNDGYRRRKRSDDMQYGGGNGGYDSNKRHRNNDYNYRNDRYRDNYRGRDYGRDRDQHRSGDDDVLELRRRVISLGDSVNVNDSQAVHDVLSRCGDWLGEQLMFQAQEIAALVVTCAGRLSAKTEWYGMLTTLLNEKNAVFGKKVVELALQAIQTDLTWWEQAPEASASTSSIPVEYMRIKSLVRFIGNLTTTKMVLAPEMVSLLSTLQSICMAEAPKDAKDTRSAQNTMAIKDFFAYLVLDTILHCGHTLVLAASDHLDQLLTQCKEYLNHREVQDSSIRLVTSNSWLVQRVRLNIVCDADDDTDMNTIAKSLDPLSVAWSAVDTLVTAVREGPAPEEGAIFNSQWKVQSLLYPLLNFMPVVRKTEPAPLPVTLKIESLHPSKVPPYAVYYRILDDESGPIGSAIANMHLPSYVIARSYFEDILEAFRPNPTEAAKQLLATTRSLNGRWNLQAEYILIETLLVTILTSTSASNMVAYGGAVLFQLLKNESKSIQSAFAIMVELLFRRVPLMQMGVLDTFVRFFSLFLSNFEYKWPWAHWNHVLDAQADDAQRLFVSAVIERCVRLSYRQHMQSILPENFHMLLPPNPVHIIRFRQDESGDLSESITASMRTKYEQVFAKIKAREDPSAIQAWYDADDELEKNVLLEMVVAAVLDAGSATFTHFRSLLDKYLSLLTALVNDTPTGEITIHTVGSVWEQSPQHVILILSILMREKVITPLAITSWMFSSDAVQQYSWPYVWEILDNTITYAMSQGSSEVQPLLIAVFEGMIRVIAEHKAQCDKEGTSFKDNWYASTLARMEEFGRKVRVEMEPVLEQLERDVFSPEHAEHDVRVVFAHLQASYQPV